MNKVRRIIHKDGRVELERVLNREDLESRTLAGPLAFERSIVWLEDVERLYFVRAVAVDTARSRRGPLQARGAGRVVGYSRLTADAPVSEETGCYVRRLFYVKDRDAVIASLDQLPATAVDPRTVFPGLAGERPSGTWQESSQPPLAGQSV